MACTGTHYGGFTQTLFLGCSVVSFSANAGWNEQSTEVTIELVEDTCGSPSGYAKRYWDLDLNEQSWTDPDPGFVGETIEIVGMSAYFRMEDFEFCGLIQSWEKTQGTSGFQYVVKLVSPVGILENTKLIVGEYAGPLAPTNYTYPVGYAPNNLINIFGYAEAQGLYCPQYYQDSPGYYLPGDGGTDGAVFGTPAGGFGGSLLNENGMPWYMIKNIFNVLVNSSPIALSGPDSSKFSPHGRLTGRADSVTTYGSPWTNGFGLLDYDSVINTKYVSHYFVDISELPSVPQYFRFNQSEISLLEAISRVCGEAGHDFYIEMLPIQQSILDQASDVVKFIKIRTVSRISAPMFGVVDNFINSAQASGILQGSSSGKEFRNEINSRFVVGGLKQTLYQAYDSEDPESDGTATNLPSWNPQADDMILPFFGTHSDGDMIVPYLDSSGYWEFTLENAADIESSLTYVSFNGQPVTINERELMASESLEGWVTYIRGAKTDTYAAITGILNLAGEFEEWTLADLFPVATAKYNAAWDRVAAAIHNDEIVSPIDRAIVRAYDNASRDFFKLSTFAAELTSPIRAGVQHDSDKLFRWVKHFADDYYGVKYAVRVPYSCVYVDDESNQVLMSEQPTQDGGWTEVSNVLGLPLNSDELTFFRNDTNKIETIVAFTGITGLDVREFGPDEFAIYNDALYVRGSVDSEYVYHDATGYQIPRAVVEIPDVVTTGHPGLESVVAGMLHLYRTLPEITDDELEDDLDLNAQIDAVYDAYANAGNKVLANLAVKFRARTPNGVAFGMQSNIDTYGPWVNIGPVGGIEVEKDDGLVPWEYGGYTNLNLAGDALALSNVTNMQVGEMGSISVVGYPTIPLGAELNSLSLLAGQQLVENRVWSSDVYAGTFADSTPFSHTYYYYDYGFAQTGLNGPIVTNIGVNVGSEVTTQYQMRTYTPKFGRFARLNAERLKEVNQNRMRYIRDLRNYVREKAANKNASSIGFKSGIRQNIKYQRKQILDQVRNPGTPHELFVGQLINWGDAKRTIIATESMSEASTELASSRYSRKSITSLETIIRPISIKGGSGTALPRLITPIMEATGSFTGGNLPIIQADLNPYMNPRYMEPSGFINRRYDYLTFGDNMGHDFDFVTRSNFLISGTNTGGYDYSIPSGGLLMNQTISGNGMEADYHDDYRTFALRGPILLHSWGYDTDGKPIPNHMDTPEAILSSGTYATSGLSGTFMSGFARRSDTWPAAPVDLRLNRQRGVWEAGGIATFVIGETTTTSSSVSTPFQGDKIEFLQGSDTTVTGSTDTIIVDNTFGWSVNPGLKFAAMRSAGAGGNYTAIQLEC